MELAELVPVKTAGDVAVLVAPGAPTSRVVLQGAHEVIVVVISTRVCVTDPDVTVEKTRLSLPAVPDVACANTQEMMAKNAARARNGDENFMMRVRR